MFIGILINHYRDVIYPSPWMKEMPLYSLVNFSKLQFFINFNHKDK